MAVNTENISLGICDATFGDLDLGATKGGVEVAVATETYEVTVDQTGTSVIKELVVGTTVTVTIPLAETDLARLKALMPQAVGILDGEATVGVEIRSGTNIDIRDFAETLKLHPHGKAPTYTKEDFTVFKAGPSPNFTFRYETGSERIYEATFKAYPDGVNNRLAAFGALSDPTP